MAADCVRFAPDKAYGRCGAEGRSIGGPLTSAWMACVFAFILSFGLGPGGVTNILTIELFTQSARPAAYTIAGSVSWLSFFTIEMLFPFIVRGLHQYCFLVFLAECALMAIFLYLIIPETKTKTFLEVKGEFDWLNFGRRGCHVQRQKESEEELLGERRHLSNVF